MPPRDQGGGSLAVAVGRGNNQRRVRYPCIAKFFDSAKNWNIAAHFGGESLGPLRNGVAKPGECAIYSFLGQFKNVNGMYTPHSAQTHNNNFDRLVHRSPHPTLRVNIG